MDNSYRESCFLSRDDDYEPSMREAWADMEAEQAGAEAQAEYDYDCFVRDGEEWEKC